MRQRSGTRREPNALRCGKCASHNTHVLRRRWRQRDGAIVRRWSRSTIDLVNQLEHTEDRYEVIVDGEVVTSESLSRSPATRIYTQAQAAELCETAGFTNVRVYSGFTRQPASATDAIFTVWGTKA